MNKDVLPLAITIDIPKECSAPLLELCRQALLPILLLLDQKRLTTKERKALGGILFHGGADFIDKVRLALQADPALFAHLPISASALAEKHDQALELLFVSQTLQQLQRHAHDAYLIAQNRLIKKAVQILEHQALSERRPLLGEEETSKDKCRSLHLLPAQNLLITRKGLGRRLQNQQRTNKTKNTRNKRP